MAGMRLPAFGEGEQKAPEIGVRFHVKHVCALFPLLSLLTLGLPASSCWGGGRWLAPVSLTTVCLEKARRPRLGVSSGSFYVMGSSLL